MTREEKVMFWSAVVAVAIALAVFVFSLRP